VHERYRSALNRDVALARPGEFPPLAIGPLVVDPPVVLAPMAGVTNAPFRTLCRRFGAGLYVSEMITARALVEGDRKTERLASFAAGETPRSLQLYGVDPKTVGEAVARLVGEGRVDHVDLNFGCVPVTLKFRIGIDAALVTFLEAGRIGEDEGCAAVALHARTAAQLYDGAADWDAVALLKQAVRTIPVLGNGDVFEAHDALRMMRRTGCDGVVVGRGCLGRPWLFRDLADVFAGREPQDPPALGEVRAVMREHAGLLAAFQGERPALRAFRKHAAWYTKAFPGSARLRQRLLQVSALGELDAILAELDPALPYPPEAMRVPRGKHGGTQRVALPEGFLASLDDDTPPGPDAEDPTSGG
jgi:tRNA-dihydrouridine synthase